MIETPSLRLQTWLPEQILALVEAPDSFAELTGVPAAEGLRDFIVSGDLSPEWFESMRKQSGGDPWTTGFAVIHRDSSSVVGTAAFKGRPDESGMVEIAYGIVPSFEGRGFATEAARALADYASASDLVKRIRAHTLREHNASTKVLKRCGFDFIGEVIDPEDGPVWRWERGPSGM
jgi:RimJ/RimL family protein N-acetyltransferase